MSEQRDNSGARRDKRGQGGSGAGRDRSDRGRSAGTGRPSGTGRPRRDGTPSRDRERPRSDRGAGGSADRGRGESRGGMLTGGAGASRPRRADQRGGEGRSGGPGDDRARGDSPRGGGPRADRPRADRPRGGNPRSDRPRGGADRRPRQDRDARGRDRDERPIRAPRAGDRIEAPELPDDVSFADLDKAARGRLRTLSKDNAEDVGRHLVMAGLMIDHDPELAYQHAQVAVQRGGRVDIVREAAALTAYATGRYAEALREFRTVRRLNGANDFLPQMADCERGLGRPERALELAVSPEATQLDPDVLAELQIVAAGARSDMGDHGAALVLLQRARAKDPGVAHRISEATVDVLRALGREDEAAAIEAQLPAWSDDDAETFVVDLATEPEPEPEPEPGPEVGYEAMPERGLEHGGHGTAAPPSDISDPTPSPEQPKDS